MRVLVVGPGAVGTLIGVVFGRFGHEVTFFCREGTQASYPDVFQIRGWGRPQLFSGAQIRSVSTLAARETLYDAIIFCVKSFATREAALDLLTVGIRGNHLVSLQNGVGNEETLADYLGGSIIAGTLTFSVESPEKGLVLVHKPGRVGLAPFRGGNVPPQIHTLFRTVFEVALYDDAAAMNWSKALLNMMGNGVPALLSWAPEQVYSEPMAFRIEILALKEAVKVMSALGIRPLNLLGYPVWFYSWLVRLPLPVLEELRPWLKAKLAKGRGGKLSSIAADVAANQPQTEVPWLYGAVAARGQELGIRTPVCSLLAHILSNRGAEKRGPYLDNPQAVLEEIGPS